MGGRVRALVLFAVILLVGALVGSAVSEWRTRARPAPVEASPPRPVGRVRVEVLNGGGRVGAAREATDLLRDLGFDVVFFGNAASFDRDSSVVLDRRNRLDVSRAVADALGIRNVRSEPDSNLYLDVSVVLGREWAPTVAAPDEERDPRRRPWWDPRGWLGR